MTPSTAPPALAVGHNAQASPGTMAIGDDVDVARHDQPGVLYVGKNLAIGAQVLGRNCNLQAIVLELLEREGPMADWTLA